jgi:hypothetical protein
MSATTLVIKYAIAESIENAEYLKRRLNSVSIEKQQLIFYWDYEADSCSYVITGKIMESLMDNNDIEHEYPKLAELIDNDNIYGMQIIFE